VDRNHHAFKKRLIVEILKEVHKVEGATLQIRIASGIARVQEAIGRAGSLAKHNKLLQQKIER
jgi:hypothetical protein